jgi:ABC-type molybdate transport system substrate-binding protein
MAASLIAAPAASEPLRIYAAGSLAKALPPIIAASGVEVAPPVFGPAGALGDRLLGGENADLFASADMAKPRAVAAKRGGYVVAFARNRMCVASPKSLGLTQDNLLDRLLSPSLRLATSTPVVDPGGDYALDVFDKADAIKPGAGRTLADKALHLLGAPGTMTPRPGHSVVASIFLENRADALIYYCSGAADLIAEVPDLVSAPLPASLDVRPIYGLGVLSDRPEAARLALFILSDKGQALLAKAGLTPIAGD